jgi:hypothetical protein
MHGKGKLSIRSVVRRDDRVTQALQQARENPEYRRVVIDQKDLQWAHFSHKAPDAGPKAGVSSSTRTTTPLIPLHRVHRETVCEELQLARWKSAQSPLFSRNIKIVMMMPRPLQIPFAISDTPPPKNLDLW